MKKITEIGIRGDFQLSQLHSQVFNQLRNQRGSSIRRKQYVKGVER